MRALDRREFLVLGGQLAALMGLGAGAVPKLAHGLEALASGGPPVIWLQGQSCSGCSVSLLNSTSPGPASLLTRYISLLFHSTLSTATGQRGVDIVNKAIDSGGFYLVFEGAVPAAMPHACEMAHEPMGDILLRAARKADAVVAIGTCAAFGGIPAAEGNPTGACSAPAFLSEKGVNTPVVRLPGCPCRPDWFVGTLVHLLEFGMPDLDTLGRPTAYYGKFIHDQCPRFADYERESFAEHFSDDGCLFKLGCPGPVTHADCTLRYWNGGANTCIRAGAPCIGCASEGFARRASLPFYPEQAPANTVEETA